MSFTSPLTIGSETFERQREGQYILTTSTIDQPDLWILRNQNLFPNNGKEALITIKNSKSKNSSVLGSSDNLSDMWFTMKHVPGTFTQEELQAQYARFTAFMSSATFTRLLRAEI